ncbi:hypothetical protein SLE2022_359990 [Rubroshorea leprosula]
MEKRRPQKRKSSNPFCIPRFRGNKNRRTLPMTLLERLREAAFRLIMLSALSKASNDGGSSPDLRPRKYYYPAHDQTYQSEAVADCIEFIKKKSSREENRDSTTSTSSSTLDAAEIVRSSWS